MDVDMLSVQVFEKLLNEDFMVSAGGETLQLSLKDVTSKGAGVREGGAFSLLFQGPVSPVLDQATYRMSHPDLGDQDLFLVPVNQKDAGIQYEAIFA